jgi:tetratricopeptide (TPR) repeat protein
LASEDVKQPAIPTRNSREVSSPAPTTRKTPSAGSETTRGKTRTPTAPASETTKAPTLRERAMANPARTRAFLARNSVVSAPANAAINIGLSYGYGWPSCGSGITYGNWDDGCSNYTNWCDSSYSYGWQCNPYGWWYGSYWNCWPYGSSYWWWSAAWYPLWWYASYPSTVVVYEREAPVSYPIEYYDSPVGEGVLAADDQGAGRAVDNAVGDLLSATGQASARAGLQNLTLGDSAFREKRYGDAVHYYAKAIEFQPDEGVLYLVLSDALFATGDYHYGAYALRKALELDPSLLDKAIDKHEFYGDPTDFDRQLAVLELYLKDRPADQDARLLLAANYLFGLRPAAAVDLLESDSAESLRRTSPGILLLEAARRQQYDAAKSVLQK